MDSIYIPHLLKAPNRATGWEFREFIAGLETLTPVKGKIHVTHGGNFLEVTAQAEGIVTLTCDRCLQQYNYRLDVDLSEIIWLNEATSPDAIDYEMAPATNPEDFEESLSPQGHFPVETWIYEQLCLQLPQQQLCDVNCPGIPVTAAEAEPRIDQRWASLANLQQHIQPSDRQSG